MFLYVCVRFDYPQAFIKLVSLIVKASFVRSAGQSFSCLVVVSYADRMLVHDWRSLSQPWLLWINTLILILTSVVFHRTKVLAERNEFEKYLLQWTDSLSY